MFMMGLQNESPTWRVRLPAKVTAKNQRRVTHLRTSTTTKIVGWNKHQEKKSQESNITKPFPVPSFALTMQTTWQRIDASSLEEKVSAQQGFQLLKFQLIFCQSIQQSTISKVNERSTNRAKYGTLFSTNADLCHFSSCVGMLQWHQYRQGRPQQFYKSIF